MTGLAGEWEHSMRLVRLEHASVVFTDRVGGVSDRPYDSLNLGKYTDDDSALVEANLGLVRERIGLARLWSLRQEHGARLHEVTTDSPDEPEEGDGLLTQLAGEGLLVTGADCPPVALATPSRVAILHCGWRPLAAGIVEKAIARIGDGPLQAAIGPGIGAARYEVGPEVPEALGPDGRNHYANGRLDLRGVIEEKLDRARPDFLETNLDCTFEQAELYFSHRRDKGCTGRQAGIAWRN